MPQHVKREREHAQPSPFSLRSLILRMPHRFARSRHRRRFVPAPHFPTRRTNCRHVHCIRPSPNHEDPLARIAGGKIIMSSNQDQMTHPLRSHRGTFPLASRESLTLLPLRLPHHPLLSVLWKQRHLLHRNHEGKQDCPEVQTVLAPP